MNKYKYYVFYLHVFIKEIIYQIIFSRVLHMLILLSYIVCRHSDLLLNVIFNLQVTSEQVIQVYISRVKEVNVVLNAVVEDRFERALQEARAVDKLIASNKKSDQQLRDELPLLGVPITVKESIAVEGTNIRNSGV